MAKSKKFIQHVADAAQVLRRLGAGKLGSGYLNPLGQELPDPTPIEVPLQFRREQTLTERLRDMVRSEALRREAQAAGAETFEEADDFDVGDDHDPTTPYEEVFEPVPDPWGRFREEVSNGFIEALAKREKQAPGGGGAGELPPSPFTEERPVKAPAGPAGSALTADPPKT